MYGWFIYITFHAKSHVTPLDKQWSCQLSFGLPNCLYLINMSSHGHRRNISKSGFILQCIALQYKNLNCESRTLESSWIFFKLKKAFRKIEFNSVFFWTEREKNRNLCLRVLCMFIITTVSTVVVGIVVVIVCLFVMKLWEFGLFLNTPTSSWKGLHWSKESQNFVSENSVSLFRNHCFNSHQNIKERRNHDNVFIQTNSRDGFVNDSFSCQYR